MTETPEQADYLYEIDDWEYTYEQADFRDVLNDLDYNRRVVRVGRLKRLSDQYAARVPVGEPDEDGEYEDYEWQYFDTEAEAQAAAKVKVPDA